MCNSECKTIEAACQKVRIFVVFHLLKQLDLHFLEAWRVRECGFYLFVCFQVIGYSDTDVAEYIYKSKPDLVSLVNHLCKDLTDACSKKPPPVPKVLSYTLSWKPYTISKSFHFLKLKCVFGSVNVFILLLWRWHFDDKTETFVW